MGSSFASQGNVPWYLRSGKPLFDGNGIRPQAYEKGHPLCERVASKFIAVIDKASRYGALPGSLPSLINSPKVLPSAFFSASAFFKPSLIFSASMTFFSPSALPTAMP